AFEIWLRKNGRFFQNLRSVEFGSRALNNVLGLIASKPTPEPVPRKEVVRLLIEKLVAVARKRGAMPVFLYLKQDIRDNRQEESWRKFLAEELEARQVLFIDLMSEFRSLPPDELKNLYHPRWRHYTAEANARVARAVLARLPPLIRTPGGNRSSLSNSAAEAGQL
ncbi:MAG: SGNH/GDSL hydrolase family protein, partial [Methylococcaceae bacterium]|nr:SGNH/GDSL hydrolase family protein [Methylococcaceae bacterium]